MLPFYLANLMFLPYLVSDISTLLLWHRMPIYECLVAEFIPGDENGTNTKTHHIGKVMYTFFFFFFTRLVKPILFSSRKNYQRNIHSRMLTSRCHHSLVNLHTWQCLIKKCTTAGRWTWRMFRLISSEGCESLTQSFATRLQSCYSVVCLSTRNICMTVHKGLPCCAYTATIKKKENSYL